MTLFDFDSFRSLQGGPKEAKFVLKMSLDVVKTKKSENVDFVHPSLAKSLFVGSYEGQDRAPIRAISQFYGDQKS